MKNILPELQWEDDHNDELGVGAERKMSSGFGVKNSRLAVPALIAVLIATLLSVKLISLPLNRILELRYCVQYYQTHDPSIIPTNGQIPESNCKLKVIQQQLGWMMGALDTTVQACGWYNISARVTTPLIKK